MDVRGEAHVDSSQICVLILYLKYTTGISKGDNFLLCPNSLHASL